MPPLEKGFIRGKNPRSHPQVLLEVRILHKISRDKIKIIHNRSLVPIKGSSNKDPLQIHQVSHTAVVKQQFRVRILSKVVPVVTEISNNNIHRRQLRVRRQLQPPRHQQLKPPRHHTGAASIFLPRRALQALSPLQNLFLAKLILTYKVCKCIQELPGSTPMTPGLLMLMQQLVSTLSNPNTQPQAGHGGTCSHKQPLGG